MWMSSAAAVMAISYDRPTLPSFPCATFLTLVIPACIDGSTDCVRRLLRAGASTLPPDAWGRDPAAVARQLGRAGPLKLLEAAAAAAGGGSSGGSGRKSLPPTFMRSPSAGVDAGGDGLRAGDGGGRVRITGNRWVVMNEGGRMLERGSGKVRLVCVPA